MLLKWSYDEERCYAKIDEVQLKEASQRVS